MSGARPAPASGDFRFERATLDRVLPLREQYRLEMRAQIVHDSWHARGFTDVYLIRAGAAVVGYGAVGGAPGEPRDTVKELFLQPEWRGGATRALEGLVAASGASAIEAQTNDRLLATLFFDLATEWHVERVLFADALTTQLPPPDGVIVRPLSGADRATIFPHALEPCGDWGLDLAGEIVATGGVMSHYNPPYGDVYMEVAPAHRQRGYGSYLVQELKRVCREQGGIPAARCRPDHLASRRTLSRAGLFACAHILRGRLGAVTVRT